MSMKKPRIFINMHYMELGGAERALLGLLYAIDTNKVDVDLFINQHTGPFMKLIPSKINLLPEIPAYSVIEKPLSEAIKNGQIGVVLGRSVARMKYRYYLRKKRIDNDGTATHFVMEDVTPFLPSLKHLGHYDLAISFLDPPHIVQDKVDATKKIEWIHTDFSGGKFRYDAALTYNRWDANDYIISISDDVTKQFLTAFPNLKDKIIKIENIIPRDLVIGQADTGHWPEYVGMEKDVVKICSVGRLSYPKNFDSIPTIAKVLKSKGLKFHWWIVGPGDVDYYMNRVNQEGVEDCVSFIGGRDNPYPYMKNCDLYVQPSRYEGKAVTVQEAQMLARPVIITRYPTSDSQLTDGEDGIICEMDNESIANAIYNLASDKKRMKELGQKAAEMHCGNVEEVEKLYELLEG